MKTNKHIQHKLKAALGAITAGCLMIACLSLCACGGEESWTPDSGLSLYDYNMQRGTVATNSYFYGNMEEYDSRLYYVEDDQVTSKVGIDVSSNNNDINWSKVAAQGIDFAYIRAGYRGTTEGGLNKDKYYDANIDGAKAAGLQVGVYFFSQATSETEAHEEADFLLQTLGDTELDLPVVYDLEISSDKGSRTEDLDSETATAAALTFCEDLRAKGYNVMVYMNKKAATNLFDLSQMQDYSFWYAEYDVDSPTLDFDFCTWQYRSDGEVFGIDGKVDMDIMFQQPKSNHK